MNNPNDLVQKSLSSKEVLVLSKISQEGATSQREISKRSGLSLGMINILIKNLVQKGYVKLSRLNKKNIKYLLTTEGLAEQYRLTRLYIQDAFTRIGSYKEWVAELIEEKLAEKTLQFIIIGKNELTDIVEIVLKNYDNISYVRISQSEEVFTSNMIILDCQSQWPIEERYCSNHEQYINIIEYLSQKMNQ